MAEGTIYLRCSLNSSYHLKGSPDKQGCPTHGLQTPRGTLRVVGELLFNVSLLKRCDFFCIHRSRTDVRQEGDD